MDRTGTRGGGGGDSDGEDAAMTYFLPNGITDDSPPKRSAMKHSSFGPIGGRFGSSNAVLTNPSSTSRIDHDTGMFRQRAVSAAPSLSYGGNNSSNSNSSQPSMFSRLNLSSGRSSEPSLMSSIPSTSSSSRSPFLLSELGGEMIPSTQNHADYSTSTTNTTRSAFSPFSGVFSSFGGSSGTGTSTFGITPAAFRQEEDALFGASSSTSSSGLGGFLGRRPPLASSTVESSYLSSNTSTTTISTSASHWPTPSTTKQPLSAPPGLSKPTPEEQANLTSATMGQRSLTLPTSTTELSAYSPPFEYSRTTSANYGGITTQPSTCHNHLPELRMSSDTFLMPPTTEYTRPMRVQGAPSTFGTSSADIENDFDSSSPLAVRTKLGSSNATPRRHGKSPRTDKCQAPSPEDKRKNEIKERGNGVARTPTRRGEISKSIISSPSRASTSTSGRGSERRAASRVPRELKDVTAPSDTSSNETSTKPSRKQRGESKTTIYRPVVASTEVSTTQQTSSEDPTQEVASTPSEAATTSRTSKVREPRACGASKRGQSSRNTEKPAAITVTRRQVYREKVQPQTTAISTPEEIKDVTEDQDKLSGSDGDGDVSGIEEIVTDDTVDNLPVLHPYDSTKSDNTKSPKGRVAIDIPVKVVKEVAIMSPVRSPPKNIENACPDYVIVHEPIEERTTTPSAEEEKATPTNQTIREDTEQASSPPSQESSNEGEIHESRTPIPLMNSEHFDDDSVVELSTEYEKDDLDLDRSPSSTSTIITPPHSASSTSSEKKSKKEKNKKDKGSEKKALKSQAQGKAKKDKRDSNSKGREALSLDDVLTMEDVPKATAQSKPLLPSVSAALVSFVRGTWSFIRRFTALMVSSVWQACVKIAELTNFHGVLGAGFAYIESGMAVVFSVVLLLSLHGVSWFIRIHRVAFRAVLTHRHIGFCFVFLYAFPFLVQYVFPWAPPWAPVCLWYAFLVQLFCTNGPTAMVTTFRILLPLVFLVEGISHHSFLLDLSGAELLLASFILSAMKTRNLCSPIFLLSLSAQCFSTVFLGSELIVQWFQMALALYSLHSMAGTDEDRGGFGEEEDDISCQSMPLHHSIADYNSHPAPSAPSIQKTKRLDRRALAFVRGRKLR